MARPIAFIDLGPRIIQYFSAVGERLEPEFPPLFFALGYKSRSIVRKLGREVHPVRCMGSAQWLPRSVALDTPGMIDKLRTDKNREQVRLRTPYYRWLVGEVHDFLANTRPAGVFLWNGSGLAAVIAEQLACARGIPLIFGENGYLPGTLQLDPSGVNTFASFGSRWSSDRIRGMQWAEGDWETFARMLSDYKANRLPKPRDPAGGRVRPSWNAYLRQALRDLRHRDLKRQGNRLVPDEIPELPRRFAFFPLQVRQDSQLTVHSPLYGNRLEDAIADLRAALQRIDPGLPLVVKLHPADMRKSDYDPTVRAYPEVIWVGRGDVRKVLERSTLVITINSTVGIEGLIFRKPVVMLGNSPYGHEGLVHRVGDRSQLPAVLREALAQPPNARLVEKYLMFLYYVAFTRGHWKDFSPASLERVASRIRSLIESADPPGKSPGSNSTR